MKQVAIVDCMKNTVDWIKQARRAQHAAAHARPRAQRSSMQDKPVDWINHVGTFRLVLGKHVDGLEAVGIAHDENKENSRLEWMQSTV